MPRAGRYSPWIEGGDDRRTARARIGVAKLGLISLKGLGLIVAAILGVAWLSEEAPRSYDSHGLVLRGEPGGGSLALAVSPDGATIARTDLRGHLALWQTDDGWWSESLLALGGYANAAVFSPDGRFLAGGGDSLALWELGLHGATELARLPMRGVQALAFSPDGKTLAVTLEQSGEITLWDLAQGGNERRCRAMCHAA